MNRMVPVKSICIPIYWSSRNIATRVIMGWCQISSSTSLFNGRPGSGQTCFNFLQRTVLSPYPAFLFSHVNFIWFCLLFYSLFVFSLVTQQPRHKIKYKTEYINIGTEFQLQLKNMHLVIKPGLTVWGREEEVLYWKTGVFKIPVVIASLSVITIKASTTNKTKNIKEEHGRKYEQKGGLSEVERISLYTVVIYPLFFEWRRRIVC